MGRVYDIMDFTGYEYGMFKVIGVSGTSGDTATTRSWLAMCICGNSFNILHKDLTSKKRKTCGCGLKTRKFLPGVVYGLLTIVCRGEQIKDPSRNYRLVGCVCSCGNPEIVKIRDYNLSSGNTTSCGCVGKASRITHGMSYTREYSIWEGMKRRCREDLKEEFPYHAGKGIRVCQRWESFENFFEDMGTCPEGLSLDREDSSGDYHKDNCRWATDSLQGYNKGLDPNNTSGKSGVSLYSKQNKWSAEIHVDGVHIRLGMFSRFEDAVKSRENAELKYYGFNKE